jgi:O-antigen/teichoic acid export membrane protein
VASFAASVERLFRLLALGGMALLALIGFTFIAMRVEDPGLRQQALVGWTVQILAIGILIPAAGRTALIQGAGGMLTSQRRLLVARLTAPGVIVAGLCCGLGVISLGLGTLTMAVVQWLSHRRCLPKAAAVTSPTSTWREDLAAMWPTTWRFTLVTLGAWMITISGTLILGAWVGLREAGQYGLSLQVLQLCTTVAAVWMGAAIPRMCTLRAAGDAGGLRRLFTTRWALGLTTFVVLAALVLMCGQSMLRLIGSTTQLLGPTVLATLVVILLLELNHGPLCAAFLMTGNQVPFVPAALASGLAIVAGSIALAAGTTLGVWSVILAQGSVQLLYNNWRWPVLAFGQLYAKPRDAGT